MKRLLVCLILLAAGCSSVGRAEREAEARTVEGDAFFNQGNYRAAIPIYEQALERMPGFPRATLQLGISWERLGMADRAMELYGEILKNAPKSPVADQARDRHERLERLKDWDPEQGPQPREILD